MLNALRSKYDEQDTVEEGSTWTHGGHVQNPEIHYGVCQVCLFGPNGCNHNETPHLLDQLYCHQARTCQKKHRIIILVRFKDKWNTMYKVALLTDLCFLY